MTNLNLKPLYKEEVYDYDDGMYYDEDASDSRHFTAFMDLFKEIHETDDKDVIASKKEEMERIRKYLIAKLDAGLLGQHFEAKGEGKGLYDPDGIWELDSNYEFGESLKDLEEEVKSLKRGDKIYFDPSIELNSHARNLKCFGTTFEQGARKKILDSKKLLKNALKRDFLTPTNAKKVKKVLKEIEEIEAEDRPRRLESARLAVKLAKWPEALARAKDRLAKLEAEMAD